MKKLLIALVAAVAVSTVFARIPTQQGFEQDKAGFVAAVPEEDASDLTAYADASAKPSTDPVPYPFDGYGSKYLDLDTGDTTLWCTNSGDATYFDMFMQFNPCQTAPDIDENTKLAVFLDSTSNLVVISSGATNVTGKTLAPGTWGRLTIAATNNQFTVLLNGAEVGSYASRTGDATVQSVGFKGTGALENYVARTTDPLLQNPAATIGGEGYASLADALADDPTATPQLEANASLATPLAYGESISVKLNGYTLSNITTSPLLAFASTSGDVTTYTTGYFPRTETAGQDGTAEHPYEIADGDDLLALQAAVLADAATFAGKSYVQTADIDMTGVEGFWGIGWFTSSDAKDSSITASGNVKFTGVYDGNNKTLSNVSIVRHNYAGIFNCIENATIADLTVSNVTFSGTCSEEGFAVVGNSYGASVIANVASAGEWPASMRHNAAGIAVRAQHNTIITGCVNNVDITTSGKRLGGILAFSEDPASASDPGVRIYCCTNYGNLESSDGTRGVAGILSRSEASSDKTTIGGCANYGTLTAGSSGFTGAIVGQLDANTYTDDGGNTFPTSQNIVGDYKGRTVAGLAYALPSTIDAVDYLTTVKQADLAAGNTYTLVANVGAGTVYTFDAAGTISFNTNGYNFAGTVAVDRSTLTPATSETVGAVVTFTAAAGVASVDDVAYATFADAVAAVASAPEGKQFVTLLADASVEFDETGISVVVRENNHTLTVTTTGEIAVTKTIDGSTDLITYTTADGVAKCNDKWYATFTAAYDAALAASGNATMVVKITDDFTPAISATYNHFYSLEFIDARADQTEGLTINLKNAAGTAYMASSRYFFPVNATLVLAADFIHANATGIISGGTLEIPEGVTVTINVSPYWAFYKLDGSAGISAIAGTGTILLPNNTFDGSTVSKTMFNNPNRCFPSLLRNNSWQGTLELVGTSDDKLCDLSQVANPGSKIRFNGFTAPTFGDGNSTYAMGIELVGDGLTLTGDYTRNYTFTGSLKGSGSLSVANTKQTSLMFTGDVSGFTGNVTVSGTGRVAFGSDKAGTAPVIYVHQGASVTNTGTWTANEIMVTGELVANGTVTGTLKGLTGYAGVYRANASTAAIASDSSWNGTYYANFDSGNVRSAFDVATNASATTVINGANSVFSGFPRFDSAAPNVAGSVVLNANWTIGDGWATNKNTGASNATTFANLSGGGNLTVNGTASGNDPIYYCITTLDGYTGALGGNRGAFVVGKVNVAEMPAAGALVVKTTIGAYGSINDNVPLYVAGADTGKTLTYDASGADGAGLYYYEPVVSYTITLNANGGSVDPASTNYTAETAAFDLPIATTSDEGVQFAGWTNETITVAFTNFVPGTTAALGDITLYAKWETSGNPQTIDPASATPTATFAAESEDDAKEKVSLVTPVGVDAADYKANFDFSATSNGDGTYTVTLTGIKDEVTADVSKDAVEILTGASSTGKVDVPAGLYYRITRYTAIGTPVEEQPLTGQSDGTGVSVSKPGTTQGFIKVEMATQAFD